MGVKEEQNEHKQDDDRTHKTLEVQSLADNSAVEGRAEIPGQAVLLTTESIAQHASAQPCAANAVKADGTGGAAEEQVAAPHGKPASLTNGSTPVQPLFSKGSRYQQAVKSAPCLHRIGASGWLIIVHAASCDPWT